MISKLILLISLALLLPTGLVGQAEKLPAWVLYEQGRQEYLGREYGKALDLLKQAVNSAGQYPEAEILIGDIFALEGEYKIARQQYLKAYQQKELLDAPDEKYTILYKLVQIYKQEEEYKNYEDTLLKIISENDEYYRDRFLRYKNQFLQIYTQNGFDRLLILYRLDDLFAAEAHAELGWFYYRSGRFSTSVLHSLFALNIHFTEIIREYRLSEPGYKFNRLSGLLELVLDRTANIPLANIETASTRENPMKTWLLGEAAIFRKLYYLACASYGAGYTARGEELWRVIAGSDYSGEYGRLAAGQLVEPWVEDYLDPAPRDLPLP